MKRAGILTLILLALVSAAFAQNAGAAADSLVEHANKKKVAEGKSLVQVGKYEEAVAKFSEVIKSRGLLDTESRYLRAEVYYTHLKKNDLALADLKDILKFSPDHAEAKALKAKIEGSATGAAAMTEAAYLAEIQKQGKLGKIKEAMALASDCVTKYPSSAKCKSARGEGYMAMARFDDAIAEFKAVEAVKPGDPLLYAALARAYEGKMEFKRAYEYYEMVSRMGPQFAQAVGPMVKLLQEFQMLKPPVKLQGVTLPTEKKSIELSLEANGLMIRRNIAKLDNKPQREVEADDQKILQKCNMAIEAYLWNASAYDTRASLYQDKGNFQMALVDFTRAIIVDPANPLRFQMRAEFYEKIGNLYYALHDYSLMIAAKPDDSRGYIGRYKLFEKLGSGDEALAELNTLIQKLPKDTEGYFYRARYYEDREKYDLALADTNRALKIKPDYVSGYWQRCEINNKKGAYALAVKDCTIAVDKKDFPISDLATIERAKSYTKLKKFDLALKDIEKAAASSIIDKSEIAARRGALLLAQGKKAEAIAEFQNALKLDPQHAEAKAELKKLGAGQ